MNKFEIDEKVISCKKCQLCKLEVNDNSKYYRGYGKLLARCGEKSNEIMIVGLNPSHVRWPFLTCHFCGGILFENSHDFNVGTKFLSIFKKFGVFDRCYITNLVKCSTADNKLTEESIDCCFVNLLDEISFCKPKIVLACGAQVFEELSNASIANVIKLNHPNYYFSYRKDQLKEYVLQIKQILTDYKFISE